jgi:hypothetical protein
MPVLELAARSAFWSLPRSILEAVAEFEGFSLEGAVPLFDCVFSAVKAVLQVNDEEAMDLVRLRMGKLMAFSRCTAEILAVGQAAACLHKDDRDEVEQLQKKAKVTEGEIKEFRANDAPLCVGLEAVQAARRSPGMGRANCPPSPT